MWILESRGDFFQGRRMWLKPGKQYLFGRVKKDGVRFALDHKTVSRKHFIISIDEVKDIDVGNTRARTVVTITDQGSKTGTLVNGSRAKETQNLTQTENVIRLGTCQEELVVKWDPVILTYNLLKKELKNGMLRAKQERIRELDIKVISEYVPGTTTYLVVNKRNTAKGLQALVDGRYLVDESYIDALEYAATPSDLEEEENLSPLELDFDKAWPNPADHLPATGKEPTLRKDESYRPDATRDSIFQGYTFVFADQAQYENLLPPITTGHGKALLFPLVEGDTTATELITYMRNAAGNKGFGDEGRDTDNGAVIMVRWTSKTNADWTNQLVNEVALRLDQRAIEQSEFLDAILASNASQLRRSVPYESAPEGQVPPLSTAESATSQSLPTRDRSTSQGQGQMGSAPSDADVPVTEPASRPTRIGNEGQKAEDEECQSPPAASFRFSPRIKVQSSTFDDDFDEDAVIPFDEDDDDADGDIATTLVQEVNGHAASARLPSHSSNDDNFEQDGGSTRKRARPLSARRPGQSDIQDLDDFLPAATAMKRQKLTHDGQLGAKASGKPLLRTGIVLSKPKSRTAKDLDIKEELRAQKERDKQRKGARDLVDDDDQKPLEYDEQGKLLIYEVQTDLMDLPVRRRSAAEAHQPESHRWDPNWNGRKNFKAFRRARDNVPGASAQRHKASTKVIVPLVDARQATYGIGDQYWDRTEDDREQVRERRKGTSQRTTQSQHLPSDRSALQQIHSDTNADESHEEAERLLEDDESSSQMSSRLTRLQQEAAEIVDDEVDIDQPRRTRVDDARPQSSSSTQLQTQTQSSTRTTRGTKRPGSSGKGAAAKKQKAIPVVTIHGNGADSDDSDDLKFKFGKGRRTRGRGRT